MLINGLSLRRGRAGGAETYARRLFPRLLDRFDDGILLVREDTGAWLASEGWPRARHHEVRIGSESPLSVAVASLRARPYVRAHRGAVLSPYNLATPGANRDHEVIAVHDLLPLHYLDGEFGPLPARQRLLLEVKARGLRRAVARAAAVVVHAEAMRIEIDRYLPAVDQREVHVASMGAGRDPLPPDDRAAPLDLPERFVLVIASSLLPHKNIDLVHRMARLPAFADLGVDLVLVGRTLPPVPGDLVGRVRAMQDLDDAALDECYRRCTAVLNPSLAEGFGFPILEALGRGSPIVASDIAPYRELGGDLPRYFDPASAEAALDALGEVVAGDDDQARRTASTDRAARFTWDGCADGYAQVLRSVDR